MELIITGDGSHTLYVPELDEHYHSTHGAITESECVFIRNGLEILGERDSITILEVGFGTGLNALLTALSAIDRDGTVHYNALEKYPLDQAVIDRLNYPFLLAKRNYDATRLFSEIHRAPWKEWARIHDRFRLFKIPGDLQEFTPGFPFDLVYFDAFAPGKQPGMWTGEIMRRILDCLNPGGIISTYSVRGEVRRLLKENGLSVIKVPGPPGKREILRGEKKVGSRE